MNHSIWIREAASARDIDRFWAQLRAYFARDVFPDPESEERAYFLDGPEYPADIQRLHERAENRLRYLFFVRDGIEIGLAMAVVFDSEDGKCFIMEFCIYPEFRGGAGTACASAARLVEGRRHEILGTELLGRAAHSLLGAPGLCSKRPG